MQLPREGRNAALCAERRRQTLRNGMAAAYGGRAAQLAIKTK